MLGSADETPLELWDKAESAARPITEVPNGEEPARPRPYPVLASGTELTWRRQGRTAPIVQLPKGRSVGGCKATEGSSAPNSP